jgi:hypothetical protein
VTPAIGWRVADYAHISHFAGTHARVRMKCQLLPKPATRHPRSGKGHDPQVEM